MSGDHPKGRVHDGKHKPIVSQELWDRVQQCFADRRGTFMTKRTRRASEALLAGKLFDDRGNRMSPSWARKGSKRWCYYVSQAALQGDKSKAGSVVRVPAANVEAVVVEAVRKLPPEGSTASQADLRNLIDRITISRTKIQVQLAEAAESEAGARMLTLPWTPPSPYRKREIIQGVGDGRTSARPMRANARAILLDALDDAHRWLEELQSDPVQTLASIALREGKTERSIRMTLSLAFLAPNIVKAAVEGRLPRGYGPKRLVDLPMAWPEQWRVLELEPPAGA
jgi:site-specific DNA recombinase